MADIDVYQIGRLAKFVKGLNDLARETGVNITPHTPIAVTVSEGEGAAMVDIWGNPSDGYVVQVEQR